MNDEFAWLDQIYATLPKIECKGKCHTSCGPIWMSTAEHKRLLLAGPIAETECLSCPLLKNNRCSRYEIRPMICRLWGVVKKMKCPYGCKPERYLSDEEVDRISRAIGHLGGGNVPMNAMAEAAAEFAESVRGAPAWRLKD